MGEEDGSLIHLPDRGHPVGDGERVAFEALAARVIDEDYRCIMAGSIFSRHGARMGTYRGLGRHLVGMHPRASRLARRAALPTVVFNLHEQFGRLRVGGSTIASATRFAPGTSLSRRRQSDVERLRGAVREPGVCGPGR